MKRYFLLFALSGFFFVSAYANHSHSYALMSASDMKNATVSKITIANRTGKPVTVNGLYIASYDVNDCSSCFGNVLAGDNVAGAVVSPVTFKVNETIPIGQNYLYNMIYNGIYFLSSNIGTPCRLPGCSWPGDDPTIRGWCITINVASLDSSYTHSTYVNGGRPPAKTPPYSSAGISNPFDYKYPLIDPATLGTGRACLGPIKCNDKTLTCKVNTAQNESFQPYV